MFADCNIHFYHSILNRWIIKYELQLEAVFRTLQRRVFGSWRMYETYIKVKDRWIYYYRVVDNYGAIIDFLFE